jgi:hypothetical protein
MLILTSRTARSYAREVAAANGLSFPDARKRLESHDRETQDALRTALHRDYRLLCCLLRHSTGFGLTQNRFEHLLLRADYVLLRSLFPLVRVGSTQLARKALLEMASVVSYLAHAMGERSAVAARA